MRSITGRRALAVTTLISALTLASTACGGGDGGGSGGGDGGGGERTGQAEAPEQTGDKGKTGEKRGGREGHPSLTEKQLIKALIKTGDVKGYRAQRNTGEVLPPQNTMEPDRPECEAITDAVDSRPKHKRSAYASGLVMPDGSDGSGGSGGPEDTVLQVLLASYRPGEASVWMDELKRSLEQCRGFTGRAGTGEQAELEIERGDPVELGDESVQFIMKDAKGKDSPTVFIVTRAGNSTATFMSAGTDGRAVPVPAPVIAGQYQKLAAASDAAAAPERP